MNKAIFLDRDGVINQVTLQNGKPHPPKNLRELKLLPKVTDALKILKDEDFFLFVITNQPDVSRGAISRSEVEEINQFLRNSLPIDDIFTCYHDDYDNCDCRKPKPGSILRVVNQYNITIEKSFMIGDRWRDIEAGESAGCRTIFVDYGYDEKRPVSYNYKVKSLFEAAELITGMK